MTTAKTIRVVITFELPAGCEIDQTNSTVYPPGSPSPISDECHEGIVGSRQGVPPDQKDTLLILPYPGEPSPVVNFDWDKTIAAVMDVVTTANFLQAKPYPRPSIEIAINPDD